MTDDNSIEALKNKKDKIPEERRKVFDFIREHPDCTYNDICRALHRQSNVTTSRITELLESRDIIIAGERTDRLTGQTNRVYRIRKGNEALEIPYVKRNGKFRIKAEHIEKMQDAVIRYRKDNTYTFDDDIVMSGKGYVIKITSFSLTIEIQHKGLTVLIINPKTCEYLRNRDDVRIQVMIANGNATVVAEVG